MAHTFEDLIVTMFDCASSLPDEESQEEGRRCLVAVGKAHPAVFFSSLHAYLLQNTRLSGAIRAFALLTAKEVLEDSATLASVDEQQALLIINLTTQEMTMSKDADEEWPRSACDLLVTMSKSKFLVSHVVDAVLQKFPPGLAVPPHRYVAHTLGGIAEHNATGFIPFLTDILSRTVPLLQHIRTDSQRLAWSYALRAFCESIREFRTLNGKEQTVIGRNLRSQEETEKNKNSFISNADLSDKSDNDSSDTDYSDQLSLAFDHVFNMMTSKDHRVRAEAAYCIGELCLLIPSEKLIEDIRKIVPAFIAVYKKAGNDQLIVTFGICRFLEASCRDESCPLDSYLEEILNILFPNVCLSSAESLCSPVSIKNQNETFRCFHVAATRFADKIVYYLLHKMQNVQDSVKLGAINVLRHLLNSAADGKEEVKWTKFAVYKPMLVVGNDGSLSIRAKQGMCQLCVALADHGYVDVEGGENVIAFLLRNLIASDDVPKQTSFETKKISNVVDAESATSSHLRTQCGQALQTISKTCEYAHKLLWPLLFEYICVESYMSVLGDIFKCIRLLVERMEKDGKEADFETGFDSPRVARSHQVFSRLFTCLYGAPLNNALWSRTRESLLLIRALSSWFHPSIHKVTMERFEQLECILNDLCPPGSSNKSNVIKEGHVMVEPRSARVARWHAHVLDFLNFCVVGVNDGEWRCSLAAAMAKQITLCNNQPDEKALLMRCLGGVLARITNTSFVVDHIILMYRGAFHAHHVERVGCAQAVGYCASSHTDLVLTELENIAKWENIHKSSGLLGFLKNAVPYRDYSDAEMVNLRATIMLSYGYVIFYCPVDGVTQRLEQTVLLFLRRYLENPKQEVVVREALLESIFLFAVSVHPTHLNSDYIFEARNELLLYIKQCIEIESPEMLSSSVRLLGAKATAALVRLEPPLNEKDVWDLGLVLTKFTFALCREKSGLKTIDDDESSTMMEATVLQYHNALEQLVRKQATVTMVTHILKLLQPYYASLADHERSRAVEATLVVLNVYFEHATDLALGLLVDFHFVK
ncbi:hypothetical protein AB6A40_004247 [Gnathostoma spinigerum]|uniref:Uncharacterized protein n=1 Tax=Gnathostoma spinigerum TaxID=75299 RepID=A0ABD6EC35_9BILA